jgi:sigma-B regulation protein RsbU (phosphoserine phosphatase)
MPEMNGHDVLQEIKADERLRHIPVIMISALDELDTVLRCIQNGADDYLSKPFNPTFLRARLGSSLDRKRLRDQEQKTYLELKKTQEQLVSELSEAAAYVRTQLPERISGKIRTNWEFNSSSSLGGDAFGYQWLDEHRFSIYLLDVCGHGVGAALLSISALRTIRNQSLESVDFYSPAQVLAGLNAAFQMERHNNMYFTLWYGVYDVRRQELTYASGGHPPACLIPAGASGEPVQLRTPNLFIGGLLDVEFSQAVVKIEPGSRLYVLSDGVYEIRRKTGPMMTLKEIFDFLAAQSWEEEESLKKLWNWVWTEHGETVLEDDFSIVEVRF